MSTDNQHYYIPALAKIYQPLAPYGSTILRVAVGALFVAHGWGKVQGAFFGEGLGGFAAGMIEPSGLPFPLLLAWATMITEFFGGIFLILGLFTRLWAFLAAVQMYLIVFFIKGLDPFFAHRGGIEYDLVLAVIFTIIAIKGASQYSLDAKMKKVF